MKEKRISLAHGNGGRLTNELINTIIAPAFNMDASLTSQDAVVIHCNHEMMITTDGYTVDPLFFPGGDIGKLAVCGTLNDLLVSGAVPKYLTVNFFIEEGFLESDLISVINSMAQTAASNDVTIVAGDTKVLPKGLVSGVQIVTTGIGTRSNLNLSLNNIKPGDKIFVSGSVGDHGAAVLLARGDYGLQGNVLSDCQSVKKLAEKLMEFSELKFMRDPTRGGFATVCHEMSQASNLGVHLIESHIPVLKSVNAVCELLGFDPLHLASEGRIVFVSSPDIDLVKLKSISPEIIEVGCFTKEHQQIILETPLGGLKMLSELENEALPRIC